MSDPDSPAGRDRPVAAVCREGIGRSPQANSGAYRILPAGDTAIVIEFGDSIDRNINSQVLALAHRLNQVDLEGIIEYVPTFRSLMVHYVRVSLANSTLTAHIIGLMQDCDSGRRLAGGGTCLCVTIGRLLPTSTNSRCALNYRQPRSSRLIAR